jgi:hypothetical protein
MALEEEMEFFHVVFVVDDVEVGLVLILLANGEECGFGSNLEVVFGIERRSIHGLVEGRKTIGRIGF